MKLGHSFSFLLTTLLFALAQVDAAPVKPSPRMVTLPLKRLPLPSDVPPSVLLQQHINRSHRRQARMHGIEGPSDFILAKRLEKRLNFEKYEKRFYRPGVASPPNAEDVSVKSTNRLGSHGNNAKNSTVDNNGLVDGNNNSTATGDGFPQSALDGLLSNNLTPANTPTAPHSLGLDIEGRDVGYIADIKIGTPPVSFSMLMDSGSADMWVGSSKSCQSQAGGGCGNHVFLGSDTSSTFQPSNKAFQVTYGTGQVSGAIVTDNVLVSDLALGGHVFGVATLESQDFSDDTTKFDGLIGLAQSSLSNQGVLTPVESLAKQGTIPEAITSYKISRLSDGKNDGEITFGGLDQSKFDPNTLVTFDNVNPRGFWEGDFTIAVDNKDVGLTGRTAILDTGTTLIVAPGGDAQAVHDMIPGSRSDLQGGFIIPCTNKAVVSLTFGGQAFDINPVDLLFAPLDQNNLQGDCASGISEGTIDGPTTWLVGDVFLKNAYFSTNVGKNQISLAKLV